MIKKKKTDELNKIVEILLIILFASMSCIGIIHTIAFITKTINTLVVTHNELEKKSRDIFFLQNMV